MSFQDIPLKKLIPSPSNYRRSFDAAAMEELTASIKSKGVLQPILVRPLNGKRKGSFEIVAGHRRFTAAKEAGLKEIPALVKELSDEDALECQVIENNHREDPNPMDEAHGFKALIDMGKHTPETLSAKLDRSVSYVLGRLKLTELDAKVQDAIADGTIGPGHAVLFTRLKNTGDQKALLKEILDDDMSVRSAKDFIKRNLAFSLKDAPFDASSCGTCPSRSRNQTVLFDDLKKTDECTDKSCYFAKTKEHYKALLDRKKAEGFKTFTKAKKIEKLIEDRKAVTGIAATKGEADYQTLYPPEYKKRCMECMEHHAFYLHEDKRYGRHEITFGELCLNKPCLMGMQNAEKKAARQKTSTSSSSSGPNPQKIREAARECRDRFLLSTLPEKLNGYIIKKLLILQLYRTRSFLTQADFLTAIVGEAAPLCEGDAGAYRKITEKFPKPFTQEAGTTLIAAVSKALLLTLNKDLCDTLLVLAPEAGVVMSRDFAIDEAWLKGKTKDELAGLVTELGLEVEVKASSKKGDLISAILEKDLKGRVPKEFDEVLEVKASEEEEGEKVAEVMECIGCFNTEDAMTLGADGPHWLATNPSTNEGVCSECPEEIEGVKDKDGWTVFNSNGDGEDEYPAAPETATEPEAACTGPRCPECDCRPCMCDETDPTMPAPTKTKRKPRARA